MLGANAYAMRMTRFSLEPSKPFFPNGLTSDFCAESYCYVLVFVGTHAMCAVPMLPVVFIGWDECSSLWRTAFVLGVLADVGFDVLDGGLTMASAVVGDSITPGRSTTGSRRQRACGSPAPSSSSQASLRSQYTPTRH